MHICPRCQRTNPAEAVYCYFDGANLRAVALDGVAAATVSQRLPHEFVFASGRRCKTYDDWAAACQDEWGDARDLLKGGAFKQFLTGIGRLDLARAAEEAQKSPDADIALDTFLVKLPVAALPGPRLELEPRRLQLGTLRSGETMEAQLRVLNLGKGLLLGTIAVAEGEEWLRIPEATAGTLQLKATRDQVVTLAVDTRPLPAPQNYNGRLTVITNGGIVEVAVRMTVAAHPFPQPPYKGAGSPRDLAVRMRGNPKPAVPLLESGEIARWFQLNKWPYPVNGPPAQGMAAVQQFFESMGLAKAPLVRLNETELHLRCNHPESVVGQTTVVTVDRKWVYARAVSDAAWLRFTTPTVSGPQRVMLYFEVNSSQLPAGRHESTVQIICNAGQTLPLRVSVEVTGGSKPVKRRREAVATMPVAAPAIYKPVEIPLAPPPISRRPSRPILTGALLGLVLRLLLAGPADVYARVWAAPPNVGAGTLASWRQPPLDATFVKHFVQGTWWLGALVGVFVLSRRRSHWADVPCGLIAGAGAGVAISGTVACLLPLLDGPARLCWQLLAPADSIARGAEPAWLGTVAWVLVASVSWTLLGTLAGVLVRGMVGARQP